MNRFEWRTSEYKSRFKSLVDSGKSRKEISKILDVHYTRVTQLERVYGYEVKRQRTKAKTWTEDRLGELIKMLSDSTLSYAVIGEHFGVSKQRIQQVVLKKDLKNISNRKPWQDFNQSEAKIHKLIQAAKSRSKHSYSDIETTDLFPLPTHCPILGLELNYNYIDSPKTGEGRIENSASIDRLDNSKGYVKGNVVVCSWRANRIKNNGNAEEHRKIADYLDRLLAASPSPSGDEQV